MTRGRARRYLLTKQGYYPGVVASMGYDVWDWSTLNAGTLFQDSAKTTPASANGDVIGCWTDGVGGVDATQATTANKPTYATASLNGLPTSSFDGGDLLATANIAISTFAVWVVAAFAAGTTVYEHSISISTNDGMSMLRSIPQAIYVKRGGVLSSKTVSAVPTAATLYRIEHQGTYVSLKRYHNNMDVTTAGGATNDVGTGTATAPFFIGARSGVINPITATIGQLLIVSPYPTDASILTNMESYINGLWGVY